MIASTPHRARPLLVAALTIALPLALFVPHAVQAWQHDVAEWDERLSVTIHDYENRDTILNRHFDVLGFFLNPFWSVAGVLLVLAAAYLVLRRGETRLAVAIVIALAGVVVLVPVLKELFARPPVDPGGDGNTFPSGHATRALAEAVVLAAVAWPTRWRRHVVIAGAVFVLLVGIGVVYHEWHWVSDVLAGWLLAIAWLGCVWLALRPPLAGTGR